MAVTDAQVDALLTDICKVLRPIVEMHLKGQEKYQPQVNDKVRIVSIHDGHEMFGGAALTVAGSFFPTSMEEHWYFREGAGSFPTSWLLKVEP